MRMHLNGWQVRPVLAFVLVIGVGVAAACAPSKSDATPPKIGSGQSVGVSGLPSKLPTTYDGLLPYFNYATGKPFDLVQVGVSDADGGVTVQEITFTGDADETVLAYLVLPPGEGPFPAVLFEHTDAASREEFLSEAISLANLHSIAGLLVTRPNVASEVISAREAVAQVREIRRDLDLLAAQNQVDPKRIGYVGHGLGAMLGIVAAAVDPRIVAAIFMTPVPATETDTFAPHSKVPSVLFQYGTQDPVYVQSEATKAAALLPGSVEVKWYDAAHDLNDQAMADRATWLAAKLSAG